jgi:hypothetical protein
VSQIFFSAYRPVLHPRREYSAIPALDKSTERKDSNQGRAVNALVVTERKICIDQGTDEGDDKQEGEKSVI